MKTNTEIKNEVIEFTTPCFDTVKIETFKNSDKSARFEAVNEGKKIYIKGFYSAKDEESNGSFFSIQIERDHEIHYFCGPIKGIVDVDTFMKDFVIPGIKDVLDIFGEVTEGTLAYIYNDLSVRYCLFMHKHGHQGYEMYSNHKIEDPLGWGWNIK